MLQNAKAPPRPPNGRSLNACLTAKRACRTRLVWWSFASAPPCFKASNAWRNLPARVKRCVTGRGNATKEAVADMVARLVRLPAGTGELSRDATDAVGIALTRIEERRSPLLGLHKDMP